MNFRTKTAYALLFSTMLGMGVGTVSQVTTAHAAPDTCETKGGCSTERDGLTPDAVKRLNAYPSMTKDKIAYYNQGKYASGPYLFSDASEIISRDNYPTSILSYKLPLIDLSNYLKPSDQDKKIEIRLKLDNAKFIRTPVEVPEDVDPEKYEEHDDFKSMLFGKIEQGTEVGSYAKHNTSYSVPDDYEVDLVNPVPANKDDFFYNESISDEVVHSGVIYENTSNILIGFNKIGVMVQDKYKIDVNKLNDFYDLKDDRDWTMRMTLTVEGEERFSGRVFEGSNGYVNEDDLSGDEAQKLYAFEEKYAYMLKNEDFNFMNNIDKETKQGMIDNVKLFEYIKAKPTKANQDIKANVLNGGITGGIVSTEVGKDLAIEDVDFGELSIGKEIKPVEKASMVNVRDWTGGNGWKLTAQHKNAERNESLQLGVQVNENAKVDLNNEAQPVTSGESQLEVVTQGGKYTAEWGTHPTVGEFNNVIEWNLSANVKE